MSDKDDDRRREWVVVSETKVDGSCSDPGDPRSERNGSCNCTGPPSKKKSKKALSVEDHLPAESHRQTRDSAGSSPVESGKSSPLACGLDSSYARPRIVDDLLDISTLSELFSESSPQEIEKGVLEGKESRDNAYLTGGITVSNARNAADFYQETNPQSGQKTNHKQHAPCAEYRQTESPEETVNSLDLGDSEDEYIW